MSHGFSIKGQKQSGMAKLGSTGLCVNKDCTLPHGLNFYDRKPACGLSCAKTVMLRYFNGTSNRFPSVVYTTQWPLFATEAQHLSTSFAVVQESRFLFSAAILCHFLAS
ncbi:hypothetical protein EJB05_43783, partial [Eragrostis curvula]